MFSLFGSLLVVELHCLDPYFLLQGMVGGSLITTITYEELVLKVVNERNVDGWKFARWYNGAIDSALFRGLLSDVPL